MPGIMSMKNDSTLKTFVVAGALCLVCSILVSAAAVGLRGIQQENKKIDRQRNVLKVVGQYEPGMDIEQAFAKFEPKVVELDTGEYADIDPAKFDQEQATKDPQQSDVLSRPDDIAQIKRRPKFAQVYLVKNPSGEVQNYILPVKGYGLWSTMYGYLALEDDGQTVKGLIFYDHAETPGLGGEVDNPGWQAQWLGKKVYDEQGNVELALAKGAVDPTWSYAEHRVDGLSGATLTSRGVTNLLRFWLGEQGFRPYLEKQTNPPGDSQQQAAL